MSAETSAGIAARATRRLEKARRVVFGTFLCSAFAIAVFPLMALLGSYGKSEIGVPLTAGAGAAVVAFIGFYIRMINTVLTGSLRTADVVVSGVLAALLSGMMITDPLWIMLGPAWASIVALGLSSGRQIIALCAGVAAVGALVSLPAAERTPHWYMWPVMFALLATVCGLAVGANLLQKWLWDLIQEAYAAREAQTRLAVIEERLRFARDLHDLLGHNLSLIAVKSELAIRMADGDTGRAKAEMIDVRQAAREALREVRAAVRGYRVVELDAELAGVRAVLEAAGVRCTVAEPPGDLPPAVRGVLAWVVREGATNVLKHSDARRCEISFAPVEGSVVLEMVNDGAHPAGADIGTGLTGLNERTAVLGGSITAEHAGQSRFLLRAAIPLPERAPQAGDLPPSTDDAEVVDNAERAERVA
ncbi:sensor histidine kinase [Actinomadura sp. HBU206391]|uniref:sensor histidine kinase n=1 Tax=Actinomadura sp. HBU206391 TaxID=2731692 RepID=UPI001650AD7A|nr:sensor histidine kinase [Actinomadura sp. HBU206391]MBC6457099.1 sensor histidine kinase [Actinomadura sp. HBU206391]